MTSVNKPRAPMLPPSSSTSSGLQSWLAHDTEASTNTLLHECYQGVLELHSALSHIDDAGTHLTESLASALHGTIYSCVGDALTSKFRNVFSTASSDSSLAILKEMEMMLAGLQNSDLQHVETDVFGHTLCHITLLFTKLKKQYFSTCYAKMADLVHSLLCLKGEDNASGEVTKLVLKLGLADGLDSPTKSNSSLPNTPWGSPKMRKSRQDAGKSPARSGFRIMSLFERKTPPDERKSSFYVDVEDSTGQGLADEKESLPTVSITAGSQEDTAPSAAKGTFLAGTGTVHQGQTTGDLISFPAGREEEPHSPFAVSVSGPSQLASEEDLESVINLLSCMGCGTGAPMQMIPEVPSQGPLQLAVPQIYRMPSPASDTQLEEPRPPKNQVHRRSEGCLDLSGIGRQTWPNQQRLHHQASLPSVQVFSASGQRSGFDSPSPILGYKRDTPSPCYGVRDLPSPSYFRSDPPSPFRNQGSNSLGVGLGGGRGNTLSPLHWGGSLGGGAGHRMGAVEMGPGQHGTWPLYGGCLSSVGMGGVGDASSWPSFQDGSDVSDDSSTEDQFFAVGKDLSHVLCSKDGSSDEEAEKNGAGLAKSSKTWPPPNLQTSDSQRGLTPDLLEPPEMYSPHKPIQMQWSDPMSSRSMWPSGPTADLTEPKTSQSMHGFGQMQ